MAFSETQRSHTHSAESSAVSRSYATLLMPVHSLRREEGKKEAKREGRGIERERKGRGRRRGK